jgi:hypothetical protein
MGVSILMARDFCGLGSIDCFGPASETHQTMGVVGQSPGKDPHHLEATLHSHRCMDQAFGVLLAFIASQLVIIGLGLIPQRYWRGIRARTADVSGEGPYRFVRKKFCRIWRHSDSRTPVVIKQVWFKGGICKRLIIPPAAPVFGSGQPKITRRIRE